MAYRAEIEIGVKGVEALTKLQKRLEGTNFKIDEINKKQSTTFGGLAQSIQNYSRQLYLAEKALSKVAAATPQETRAVNNYVTALGNANAARERQNKLIEQEIANRTAATAALKAYNAAAAAPTQRGAATTMSGGYLRGAFRGGSQYPGPIGPGAASSTALSSPLPARSARTTQYLSPIGPISPQERTGRAEQLAREAALKSQTNQKEFEAQKAFQTKLFNIEKEFENSLIRQRVEADNAEFDRLLKRLDAEKSTLNEIDKLRAKIDKKVGEDFDRRLTEAGNLRGQTSPVGGAVGIPGSPAAKQRIERNKKLQDAASNAIIGGAFPLLFGQGIGASLGGAAGGGLGGLAGGQLGFGLSLVGTALGTAFDELVKSAQDTAKALEDPLKNLDALNEKFSLLDKTTKKTVDSLIAVGEAQKASNILQEKINGVIGREGINSLRNLGLETQRTAELFGELKLALEAIAAGPLSDVLGIVNKGLKVQLGRTVSENLRKDLSNKDLKEFDKQIAKAIEKVVKERFGKEGKSTRTGDAAANYLSLLAPDELLSIVETFKGSRASKVENKSITSEQQIQDNITKLQRQQNTLNAQLIASSVANNFTQAVQKQQELQTNYDKQRADILKSYEENLGNIRESVEQRILALRIKGIQKANEIENQRAANQLSELRAANRAASQWQQEAAVSAGTRPELAATAQTVDDAFRAIAEAELSAEQKKAQIKRDAAFETLNLELEGEKFKVQIAKQVSKLNLDTARRIEDINLNIARANEVTASNRFDLELAIAKIRLDVLKQEQESTRLLLVNAGAFEAAQQVETVIDAIRDERLKLDKAKPPQQLNPLAAIGGGSVPTTGVDVAFDSLIERQRQLTAERLKSLDILKAENKEAELAKVTNIRLEDERTINSLLIQQKDALDAQQRVLELQAEGRSEAQAVAIQRVESVFALRKANLEVLDVELKIQLAKLKGVDADKQDLETIQKVKKELEEIAILLGKLPVKKNEAVENAANLNKELGFSKQLATDVGEQLSTGITDALIGAVQGTQTLGEAFQALASDILAAVGKALILAAVTKAIGAVGNGSGAGGSGLLGLLFRADGGPVSANTPYIVGEEGPELFIPGANGSISNNDQFEAARDALATGSGFTAEEEETIEKLGTTQQPSRLNEVLRDSRSAIESISRISKERETAGVNKLVKELGATSGGNGETVSTFGSSTTNNLKERLGGDSTVEKIIAAAQQTAQAEAVSAARDALTQSGDEQNTDSSELKTSRDYIEKVANNLGSAGTNTVNNVSSSSTFGESRSTVDRITAINQTRQMLESVSSVNKERSVERAMENTASGGIKPIDVRYESQVINNVEYVTAEQHRAGVSQAAERGRALALQALQNSVKTRKRVGL